MLNNPLVSIVIPAYNSEKFLADTIKSVLNQTYTNWEIIFVNDGSTDNSLEIVNNFKNYKIKIIDQQNRGVSNARNVGLSNAKGEFILFLDSDDILSENFLMERIKYLSTTELGFCCGDVWHFKNSINNIIEKKIGIFNNIFEHVLLYKKGFDTVPSNYLFKRKILDDHQIKFDERLSSTADRLFLLEIAKVTHGIFVPNSPLYYRIYEKSMSHIFDKKLVNDNELFFKILKEKKIIPKTIKKHTEVIHAYILGNSFLKVKSIKFFKWYFWGMAKYPLSFFKYLLLKKF